MKILFIGQKGIAGSIQNPIQITEQRVEYLAKQWAKNGHEVSVICANPFTPRHLNSLMGISIVHYPSIDPQQPGGLLPLLGSLITLWKIQPEVAHFHGWKAAACIRIAALLSPETTYIWTIDHLNPKNYWLSTFIAWQAKRAFDAITSPSRQLQYWLREVYNIESAYIPDGYEKSILPDVPSRLFKLRTEQYLFTTATEVTDLRRLGQAYTATKSRKKVVFAAEEHVNYSYLKRKYPFLVPMYNLRGRSLTSIIHQAFAVIFLGSTTSSEVILEAMDHGRTMIAENDPFYEEVLGVTARFFETKDKEELHKLLTKVMKKKTVTPNIKAARRSERHFSWKSILPQYMALYHLPVLRRVPVDSLNKQKSEQKAI